MNHKALRYTLLLPALGIVLLLAACGGDNDASSGSTAQTTPGNGAQTSASPTVTPSAEGKALVSEAVANSQAQSDYNVTVKTTVAGAGVNTLVVQEFAFDGPSRFTLRETTSGKVFEAISDGLQVYLRNDNVVWRQSPGAAAEIAGYKALARIFDIAPVAIQRESVEINEGNAVVRRVGLRSSGDQLTAVAAKIIADNPALKTNLTQSNLQSIQADYFIDEDQKLIRHALFTFDAMFDSQPVKTTVEFTFVYDRPFSFPPDSPLAGR